jgi:hypothetical protein
MATFGQAEARNSSEERVAMRYFGFAALFVG